MHCIRCIVGLHFNLCIVFYAEGNANIRGGKLIQNDNYKTMLEVGGNRRKSPKFSSLMNFWHDKSENTIPMCEHSTSQPKIYTNNEIVGTLPQKKFPDFNGWLEWSVVFLLSRYGLLSIQKKLSSRQEIYLHLKHTLHSVTEAWCYVCYSGQH